MACEVEVLFAPAEFRALRGRDLSRSVCVVFDVLRASSTFVTALAHGAEAIIPVEEIAEALELRTRRPEVLLAGERNGLRIGAALTGGVEFDLGNSPREFTPERVRGKTIVSTTTNGTRALRTCAGARRVLVGSFLNLDAAVRAALAGSPEHLLLVCAGTGEGMALEDALAAGAFSERARTIASNAGLSFLDSAELARRVYLSANRDIAGVVSIARNARRLLAHPDLRDDVEYCLAVNRIAVVPELAEGGQVVASA